MILYLTSDPGGACDIGKKTAPKAFSKKNNFINALKADVRSIAPTCENRNCLIIAADPAAHKANDLHRDAFALSFKRAGLKMNRIDVCDGRSPELVNELNNYTLVFLLGGHVRIQNDFFVSIGLRECLEGYNGIILAMSAGSMNCAETVYLVPEEKEDFKIPFEKRFIPGLGLTEIQMVPHYQYLCTLSYRGKNLITDIVSSDSYNHTYTGVCDGSYYRISDGKTVLCGDAYEISDGNIRILSGAFFT